jgi:hypothetical protein
VKKTTIDPKTFNRVSQLSHFGWGAMILFAAGTLRASVLTLFAIAFVCGIAAAVKEFWYDEHYETPEVRGSSLEDFVFYFLGVSVGFLVSVLVAVHAGGGR